MSATAVIRARSMVIPQALRLVFGHPGYRMWAAISFIVLLTFYLMLLPASETGGAVGLVALPFLTVQDVFLAIVMAGLLALTLPLGVYGWRMGSGGGVVGSASGSIVALIAPLLCCSPILPITIAAIAASLPAVGAAATPLQGFIATHELEFYAAAIVLMAWGLQGNARRVLYCECRPVK
ncbi:hypothetical protein [Acidiphilium multivorum]|uniref:hypothetical protein n=1 Tax=Acidiphilium multivorum TaxID=62140 RepID=UPI001B8D6BD8|nr:hypothetical protein [Acidiphilium multivorum]